MDTSGEINSSIKNLQVSFFQPEPNTCRDYCESLWHRCILQLDRILRLGRHSYVTTKFDVGVSAVIYVRQVLSPTVSGDEGVECDSKIVTSYKAYLQFHVISNSDRHIQNYCSKFHPQTASKGTFRRINDGSKCPLMIGIPDDQATLTPGVWSSQLVSLLPSFSSSYILTETGDSARTREVPARISDTIGVQTRRGQVSCSPVTSGQAAGQRV